MKNSFDDIIKMPRQQAINEFILVQIISDIAIHQILEFFRALQIVDSENLRLQRVWNAAASKSKIRNRDIDLKRLKNRIGGRGGNPDLFIVRFPIGFHRDFYCLSVA